MNKSLGFAAAAILFFCILACDSPPWSKVIVANLSAADLTVRLKLPSYSLSVNTCKYSPEQWKSGDWMCTQESHLFELDHKGEKWVTVTIPSGGAAEIDRGRHPDIEENPEGTLQMDRLEMTGVDGSPEWDGRRQIFSNFTKEGSELSYLWGKSPRYVYYYGK